MNYTKICLIAEACNLNGIRFTSVVVQSNKVFHRDNGYAFVEADGFRGGSNEVKIFIPFNNVAATFEFKVEDADN